MTEKKTITNRLALVSFKLLIILIVTYLIFFILYLVPGLSSYLGTILFWVIMLSPLLCIALIIISFISLLEIRKKREKGALLASVGLIGGIIILFLTGSYAAIIEPSKAVHDQCVSTAGLECKSYEVDLTNSRTSIAFANNLGYPITINSVNITSRGIVVATCTDNQIMNSNGTSISLDNPVQPEEVFYFRNCTLLTENTPLSGKRPKDKVKMDFNFKYQSIEPNPTEKFASGTLTVTTR